MSDVVTSIRIDADTKAAVAELSRIDAAMNVVSKRASPALSAAFGSLSSQALSMTTGISGVSGVMSIVGQTALTISPIIGGVAIAAAAATAMFLKKKTAIQETTEVLKLNDAALVALIENNSKLRGVLNQYSSTILSGLKIEEQSLQAKLESLGLTEQQLVEMEKLGFAHIREAEAEKFASKERREEFEQVAARLAAVQSRIAALEAPGRTAAAATQKLADAQARLNEENDRALASAVADSLRVQAENAQRLLDIETQRAALRAQSAAEGGDVFAIIEASNAIIAAETAAYEQRLANANAFDGSRQVIEAQHTLFVEQELAKRDAAVRRSLQGKQKVEKESSNATLKMAAATTAQMLILQNASLRETIAAVIAEQQARLAALAIVAAAEAVYYAFTNPPVAASKAKAALMAGAGAVALGIVGSQFESSIGQPGVTTQELTASGAGGTSRTSGRTMVSQGPVTLYYSSTIVVNGSILDKGDFFTLWNEANMENLRRAGLDASSQARG